MDVMIKLDEVEEEEQTDRDDRDGDVSVKNGRKAKRANLHATDAVSVL